MITTRRIIAILGLRKISVQCYFGNIKTRNQFIQALGLHVSNFLCASWKPLNFSIYYFCLHISILIHFSQLICLVITKIKHFRCMYIFLNRSFLFICLPWRCLDYSTLFFVVSFGDVSISNISLSKIQIGMVKLIKIAFHKMCLVIIKTNGVINYNAVTISVEVETFVRITIWPGVGILISLPSKWTKVNKHVNSRQYYPSLVIAGFITSTNWYSV